MEAVGCALDQREEALASRRNVRAMLNVVRRPETIRSDVVPLVEKRFESLQHESLILFLDCLRHFILLLYTRSKHGLAVGPMSSVQTKKAFSIGTSESKVSNRKILPPRG